MENEFGCVLEVENLSKEDKGFFSFCCSGGERQLPYDCLISDMENNIMVLKKQTFSDESVGKPDFVINFNTV